MAAQKERGFGNSYYSSGKYLEAIQCYNKALSLTNANNLDELASIYKNLGQANSKIASTDHSPQVLYYWKEAISSGITAIEYGVQCKAENWLEATRNSLYLFVEGYFQCISDNFDNVTKRTQLISRTMQELFQAPHRGGIRSHFHLQICKWMLNASVILREKENYISGYSLLNQCLQELEFTKECASNSSQYAIYFPSLCPDDIFEFETSILFELCYSKTAHQLEQANSMFSSVIGDEFSVDLVWSTLDSFRQTIIFSSEKNVLEHEAHACAKMGELYFKVLKMETYAERYLKKFAELSKVLSNVKSFIHVSWWTRGHAILQELIMLQDSRKIQQEEELKKPYREMVKDAFTSLRTAFDKGTHDFVKFCWATFPVSSQTYTMPDPIPPEKLRDVVRKLLLVYHTDKHVALWQSNEDEKRKTFVIYEEISKLLSNKYEVLKA
jgi:tetratricopeptide (TPR) repeat protein